VIGAATNSNTPSPVLGFNESTFSVANQTSVPATPDESGSHESVEKDYFIAATRFAASSTRSLPERGGHALGRSISWNPKIQFHEVYTATEYDRRGEIATCNRLTPMLAQQIKEELNSFKMVHIPLIVCQMNPLTQLIGDGSPRRVEATYPLLLIMSTHTLTPRNDDIQQAHSTHKISITQALGACMFFTLGIFSLAGV
jgi:hypothetical protein